MSRVLVAGTVVFAWSAVADAQSGQGATIRGTVTNEAGAPVPGVNVFVQGLNVGTQTGIDGRYIFTVPSARLTGKPVALIARVISFTPKSASITLTAGDTASQNFVLAPNPLRLGEVVVTGAGTSTTRDRLTGTINTVDSSRIRRAYTPQNVVSALAASAPNVEVRTQSGDPGASASIRIRGTSSLIGTSQPLFVVDGQPIDNSTEATSMSGLFTVLASSSTVTQNRAADINPNDIESVEILKGSAASAIYGARASNGVILVTTKRGHAGATRIAFSSTESFDKMNGRIPLQTKYGQGNNGPNPANCGTVTADCALNSFGPLLPAGTKVYDHSDEVYDTGLNADNNLSLSGGDDRLVYYLSGGINRQKGAVVGPNNTYQRTTGRLKASNQVTPKLNVGGNFGYTDGRGRGVWKGNSSSGLLVGALRTPPEFDNSVYLDPVTGRHRSYRFPNPTTAADTLGRGFDNPFFVANVPEGRSEIGRFIGNMNVDWNPSSWLNVTYTLGADNYSDYRLEGFPLTSSANSNSTLAFGAVIRMDNNYLELDHNLVAKATHRFTDRIDGTLSAGQNLNSRRQRELYAYGAFLIAPQPYALQNTLETSNEELRGLSHIEGYFLQGELALYDQFVINAGLRNDGYSTFGEAKRHATFPKVSGAWTFTNAVHDVPGMHWMSYGKLRLAYGETGKEPPRYSAINALTNFIGFGSGFGDALNTNQSGQGGLTTSDLIGNPNLTTERTREREIGLDLGLFDQRVDLSSTYYNKRSTNVILPVPVNTAQTGSLNAYENGATISNKGFELSMNGRPYTSKNVAVDLGIQFGHNKGNVISLKGTQALLANSGAEGFGGVVGGHTVGYAPGIMRGTDFVRCGRGLRATVAGVAGTGINADIDSLCTASGSGSYIPGALVLASNGQPVADPTSRVIADPHPKYTIGYSGSVKLYNRLRLSTLVDARKGGQMVNATRASLERVGTHANTLVRSMTDATFGVNYKTDIYPDVTGPGKGVVAFANMTQWYNWFQANGGLGGPLTQFVEDASFVKLRELSLSYTLDAKALGMRTGFSTVDITVAGRNLHTWTRYTGLDPEADLGGAQWLTSGLDYFNNPQTRSLVLSVSLNR